MGDWGTEGCRSFYTPLETEAAIRTMCLCYGRHPHAKMDNAKMDIYEPRCNPQLQGTQLAGTTGRQSPTYPYVCRG